MNIIREIFPFILLILGVTYSAIIFLAKRKINKSIMLSEREKRQLKNKIRNPILAFKILISNKTIANEEINTDL